MDKLHAITENITKHDDSLFTVDRKLKTGLNCLHNFKKEKRHYIKSSVRKDVLHLVEDLGRVMAKYKATYQIGIKSTTSETRKRKTRRKRGSSQLVKTVGKKHALFSVPWEEPPLLRVLVLTVSNGKQLIVKTYIFFCLNDRQGMLARPLQGKLFCQRSPGDYLGLLHLRVNKLTTVL